MASKKNGGPNNKKDTSTSFQWLSGSVREQVWERKPRKEQETQGEIEHENSAERDWVQYFLWEKGHMLMKKKKKLHESNWKFKYH